MHRVVSKCLLSLVFAAFATTEVPATALGQALGSLEATAASYVDRGNSSFAKGEMDRAIADFSLALEFNPRYADAFYNRGAARCRKRDWEAALADFDRAIQLQPRPGLCGSGRNPIPERRSGRDARRL